MEILVGPINIEGICLDRIGSKDKTGVVAATIIIETVVILAGIVYGIEVSDADFCIIGDDIIVNFVSRGHAGVNQNSMISVAIDGVIEDGVVG